MSQKKLRDPSERIARRLLAEGRIGRDLHDAALRHRQGTGQRFEESLLEVGLSEEQLLPILAEMYRVQYVSTTKLSAAAVDKRTLAMVPAAIAENRQVVPVLLDRQRSILSVVSSDPDDIETLKELELATQVRSIRVLVARPAAVVAAVRKFYLGDDFAFTVLKNQSFDVARGLIRDLSPAAVHYTEPELTERGLTMPPSRDPAAASLVPPASMSFSSSGVESGVDSRRRDPGPMSRQMPAVNPAGPVSRQMPAVNPAGPVSRQMPAVNPAGPVSRQMPAVNPAPQRVPSLTGPPLPQPPRAQPPSAEPPMPPSPRPGRQREAMAALSGQMPAVRPGPSSGKNVAAPEWPAPVPYAIETPPSTPSPAKTDPRVAPTTLAPDQIESVPPVSRHVGPDTGAIGDPFQLAVVMVSLLEGNRRDLRGHSLQTARLIRTVCERFELSADRIQAAELAGLIHDFGKASSYHLTAYNVARFDGHHAVAQKLHATPARVVESAGIAQAALDAVTHMYERFDGTGFPAALRGNAIPLESRILSICDSYTDLTSNPRNSFRRVLSAKEACEALRELVGSAFDPLVLDRFVHSVLGDDIALRLAGDQGTILLVDPDVEETTVLELALLENRYRVRVARAVDEALRFIEGGEVDVIVSEAALDGGSGTELLEKARAVPGKEALPFVFLSDQTDGAKVAAALDAGATDYLFKPLATQVLIAKLRRILEQTRAARRVRGVSGSLEEMAIPDLVQILHQGRKTGALELSSEGDKGTVYFKDGAVVDAVWKNVRGEEAFYSVVCLTKGEFIVDPSVVPPERVIQASAEMLLLEGMRRMDEAGR